MINFMLCAFNHNLKIVLENYPKPQNVQHGVSYIADMGFSK